MEHIQSVQCLAWLLETEDLQMGKELNFATLDFMLSSIVDKSPRVF